MGFPGNAPHLGRVYPCHMHHAPTPRGTMRQEADQLVLILVLKLAKGLGVERPLRIVEYQRLVG